MQVWLLFTEMWAQSQGILALSYSRLAVYPLVLPQGFAEVQVHDKLQRPLCCGLFLSLLSFSTASALSCLAHHSLGLWEKEWVLQVTECAAASAGWWILLYLSSLKAPSGSLLGYLRNQLLTLLTISK